MSQTSNRRLRPIDPPPIPPWLRDMLPFLVQTVAILILGALAAVAFRTAGLPEVVWSNTAPVALAIAFINTIRWTLYWHSGEST